MMRYSLMLRREEGILRVSNMHSYSTTIAYGGLFYLGFVSNDFAH